VVRVANEENVHQNRNPGKLTARDLEQNDLASLTAG